VRCFFAARMEQQSQVNHKIIHIEVIKEKFWDTRVTRTFLKFLVPFLELAFCCFQPYVAFQTIIDLRLCRLSPDPCWSLCMEPWFLESKDRCKSWDLKHHHSLSLSSMWYLHPHDPLQVFYRRRSDLESLCTSYHRRASGEEPPLVS
jgi:hypothetical protein